MKKISPDTYQCRICKSFKPLSEFCDKEFEGVCSVCKKDEELLGIIIADLCNCKKMESLLVEKSNRLLDKIFETQNMKMLELLVTDKYNLLFEIMTLSEKNELLEKEIKLLKEKK